MLDGEIDFRPMLMCGYIGIERIFGQERRRLAAPCRAAGHLLQRFAALGTLFEMLMQPQFFVLRKLSGQCRFQNCRGIMIVHVDFSISSTAARNRANTRHLATRMAPVFIPSSLPASAIDAPTTAVSQKASQVAC